MSKKEQKVAEKSSKLQEILDKLDKQYGKNSVVLLDGQSTGKYDVISSGSIGLDWVTLGVGGFVKGKLYEIMGWEGSCKTTICAHVVAECQKSEGRVLYVDSEHAVDKNYFSNIGVDTSKMLICQPACGEEGFNIALQMINSGEIDLVIFDSDSALIPKAVLDGDVGDSSIGKKARLNSNAYPKLKTALSANNVCVIVISQYREKIGIMFGNPTCTQGGHALKFYSDCRIEMSKSLAKEGDVTYGNLTKAKATKNKMNSPYKLAQFDVVYGKGIDKIKEVIDLASDCEILKKWGKSITWGDAKYPEDDFREMLKSNDFFNKLKDEIVICIKNADIKAEEPINEEV